MKSTTIHERPGATEATDAPLPATLLFVSIVGGLIFIGWIAMFALLRARW